MCVCVCVTKNLAVNFIWNHFVIYYAIARGTVVAHVTAGHFFPVWRHMAAPPVAADPASTLVSPPSLIGLIITLTDQLDVYQPVIKRIQKCVSKIVFPDDIPYIGKFLRLSFFANWNYPYSVLYIKILIIKIVVYILVWTVMR